MSPVGLPIEHVSSRRCIEPVYSVCDTRNVRSCITFSDSVRGDLENFSRHPDLKKGSSGGSFEKNGLLDTTRKKPLGVGSRCLVDLLVLFIATKRNVG